jgi:CTP:molybdopterin cytidylyltransferase MocA
MKPTGHGITGIILAAGASTRMNINKALLEFADGNTLLARQAYVLDVAGCERIAIVVGSDADKIKDRHRDISVTWLKNEHWALGQFSSIQVGLSWMLNGEGTGALIQPVDSLAGSFIPARSVIETAVINPHVDAIVPEHEGRGGHPVYISKRMALKIIDLDPSRDDSRLDRQIDLSDKVFRFPVNDSGILENINTPEDWEKVRKLKRDVGFNP